MKPFFTILIFAASLVTINGCQKNLDEFIPDGQTGPDTTWVPIVTASMPVASLRSTLLLETRKDSIDLAAGTITLASNSGVHCTILPNSFITSGGTTVSGRISIQTLLLRRKGDLIRMGIPTTSNGRLMISGGVLFITARKETVDLNLSNNARIYLRYNDNPVLSNLKVFNSEQNPGPGFNWQFNTDSVNNKVLSSNTYYDVLSNRLNWINCGSLIDTNTLAQTNLSVHLPSNYTNANTTVWISFNDFRSVVGLNTNIAARLFTSGRLPVGKQVTVVVMSKQGDDFYFGHQQTITIAPSGTGNAQVVNITPVKTSLVNIKSYLDNL